MTNKNALYVTKWPRATCVESCTASLARTALGGTGPRSTPAIAKGYVYALGATGVLRCLDERGQLVWSDDLRKRYGVTSEVDEEHVIVRTFGFTAGHG